MALVQEPRPHAGPVGRVREQPRHRRRRDFRRRGGAVAASAPARALDHPRVRLDRHLDQFRRVGAVRHIRFPAIGADALVRRGVVNFRALFETRPGRAAMAGGAGLVAARTVRPRPLPALALAPEPRLGAPPDSREASQAPPRAPRYGFAGSRPPGAARRSCSACAHPRPPPPAAASAAPPRRAAKAPPAPPGEPPSPPPAPPSACSRRSGSWRRVCHLIVWICRARTTCRSTCLRTCRRPWPSGAGSCRCSTTCCPTPPGTLGAFRQHTLWATSPQ